MKTNLKDITFLVLVHIDSIERLESDTLINISRYPISLDFASIEKYAQSKGVKHIVSPEQIPKSFRKDIYDFAGLQDKQQSHSICTLFGFCCQLNNGRFYPCSISAYFHHFNRYFNLDISMPDGNYIDIYKTKSTKEFYQLITTPIPCCGYCNKKAQKFGVKWEYSKKQINEWSE